MFVAGHSPSNKIVFYQRIVRGLISIHELLMAADAARRLPLPANLRSAARSNRGLIVERMLSQDVLMLACPALAPTRRKVREQLDLPLKEQSARILCLNAMC